LGRNILPQLPEPRHFSNGNLRPVLASVQGRLGEAPYLAGREFTAAEPRS
jgi:hypothetical protein